MARLRVGLPGLNGHRNRYNFIFIDHSRCPNCNYQNENLDHYFLSCPEYATLRNKLFLDIVALVICHFIIPYLYQHLTKRKNTFYISILLYGTEN
jgi:hypothetical protein